MCWEPQGAFVYAFPPRGVFYEVGVRWAPQARIWGLRFRAPGLQGRFVSVVFPVGFAWLGSFSLTRVARSGPVWDAFLLQGRVFL